MSLQSIQNYCHKENFAGNTHIECVPVNWIESYPEFADNGHNFSQAIDLLPGKQWLVFPCVPETLDFEERERSGSHGTIDTPTISGFLPGDTPMIASVLNSAKANQWVVILYYKTGAAKVIGSPDYPARFSSSLNNRGNLNSGKGYNIEFFSEGDFKTFFLEELPDSSNQPCDNKISWLLYFDENVETIRVEIESSIAATFTAGFGNNVGSISTSLDDVTYTPIAYPLDATSGIIYIKRSDISQDGKLKLIGE